MTSKAEREDAIESIGAEVDSRWQELEQTCTFPADLYGQSIEAGLFEQLLDCSGSHAAPTPADWFRNGVRAARWNASFGWIIGQGAAMVGIVGAMDPGRLERLRNAGNYPIAATNAGLVQIVSQGDGTFVVDGTIPFCSGCEGAGYILGFGSVQGEGAGFEGLGWAMAPADEWTIEHDWDPSGLRGTGSHSITASRMVIPAEQVAPLKPPTNRSDPRRVLLGHHAGAWPISYSVAAVQLGVARRALDEIGALVTTKAPSPTFTPLDQHPAVRRTLMEAEGRWTGTVAAAVAQLDGLWAVANRGEEPDERQRAMLATTAHLANREGAALVEVAATVAGTSVLQPDHPIARCRRDVQPLLGHLSCNAAVLDFAAARWRGEELSFDVV